jgi:hypothetical protein
VVVDRAVRTLFRGDELVADEFLVECKLDQPAVAAGRANDVYSLVTIKPNPAKLGAALESGAAAALPAHLIVVVDVSGSMQTLIEPDPNARVIRQSTIEGQVVTEVETTFPSRLVVAANVVRRMIARMEPADRMTLVAFDHKAYSLARSLGPGRELEEAVGQIEKTGGGGTSLGEALASVRKSLSPSGDGQATHRIVLLTDGEDNDPDAALKEAERLGTELHVPIFAFGTGESRGDFLMQICRTTLGGSFDNIRSEREAEECFHKFVTGQKNILATNVKLQLWLSPEIFVRELYRTKPEVLFVGDLEPDAGNTVSIPVEYMERGKVYEFLFRSRVSARDSGRFRLAKATLTFDVPFLGVKDGRIEANISVEYTADEGRTQVRSGDVRRVIIQAETQRQLLFLQEKKDLIERNQGTPKDKEIVARLLDALVKKFEEQKDQQNLNLYQQMKDEYSRNGIITQEMMNRSLAASSKVEGAVAVQEIDF